jgi:hypothetical protein
MKKLLSVLLLAGILFGVSGCGDYLYRVKNYTEWHIKGAYNDLIDMQRWIDKHVMNQDVMNPNDY